MDWCGNDRSNACQCLSGKARGGVPSAIGACWTHGIGGGGTNRTGGITDFLGTE